MKTVDLEDGIDPTKSVPTVRTSGGVEFCAVFPPLADRTRFQFLDLRLFSVTDSGAASDRSSFRLIANCRSICATDPLMEHPKKKKVWFRRVDPGKYLVRYYLVRMPGSPEDGSFPENLLVGESQLVVEK